jgi:hypothetical protein
VITRDPYGISGAVAPWRSLDAMEPIVERNITERDAEEAAICGQCLLHTRAKKPRPSRDLLERMALDGHGPEKISQATGYSISTTAMYMKEFFKAGPCERCSSKSICDAVGGTCSRKERWKAAKEVPDDGR